MDYVLIIGNNIDLTKYDYNNKYVIGVDKGSIRAINAGVKLDEAVGDFDSITKEELNMLYKLTKVTKLDPIKDDTDTAHALGLCKNAKNIDILGSIQGKRIEHFLANLIDLKNDSRIRLIDDYSIIFTLDKDYSIIKSDYKYISFYSLRDSTVISLKGFKYELNNYNLKINDPLCISNELLKDGKIIIDGKVIVVMSKEDNHEII